MRLLPFTTEEHPKFDRKVQKNTKIPIFTNVKSRVICSLTYQSARAVEEGVHNNDVDSGKMERHVEKTHNNVGFILTK